MPVFKYRVKLAKSPVLGRRVARQSAAHSAPAHGVPQGHGGDRAADVTPCPGERVGCMLAPCWFGGCVCVWGSCGADPTRWWCVGMRGHEEARGATGEASLRAPATRRERRAGVQLSCAESPLKIRSLLSYWVLFLSPVPLSPWSSVVALN